MSRKLLRSVILTDPDTKETSFLRKGTTVTAAQAKAITIKGVFDTDEPANEPAEEKAPPKKTTQGSAAPTDTEGASS